MNAPWWGWYLMGACSGAAVMATLIAWIESKW